MAPTSFLTTGDGDIILRAGQEPDSKHDFRVHKFILSLASPIFKDMLTLPQPPNQNDAEQPDTPVVDISDSPEILDVILRFIYPGVEPPKLTVLSTVFDVLSAVDKYDIISMRPVLADALKSFVDAEPFRVYIAACRFGFLEEAKAAARALTPRQINLSERYEKDVRHITGTDLYRLLWFVQRREQLGLLSISDFFSLDPDDYDNPCKKHWDDRKSLYAQLEGGVQDMFKINPRIRLDEPNPVLDALPRLPGCIPAPLDEDEDVDEDGYRIDCHLQPSFIRRRLSQLTKELDRLNNILIKRAFEKEF